MGLVVEPLYSSNSFAYNVTTPAIASWRARAILNGVEGSLATFCYCSARFKKLPLEIFLRVPLEVEILESVLAGSERRRFAVKIPREKLK